jgi:hypothetical protein
MTIISHADELRRVLDAGFQVSFTRERRGYVASVSGPAGYEADGIAATPEDALAVAAPCPAWCAGGEPGHEHAGEVALDDTAALVIAKNADGEISADMIGEPSPTAEHGTVALSAVALARLAQIAATL